MRRTATIVILMIALLGAGFTNLGMAAKRLAIVTDSDHDSLMKLAVLTEAHLLMRQDVELLDRQYVKTVLEEHVRELAMGDEALASNRRIGKLLNADVLVLLQLRDAKIRAKVVDVATGLRLAECFLSEETEDLEADIRSVLFTVDRALKKVSEKRERVIAVAPFVSDDLGDMHDSDIARYQMMVELFVSQLSGCFVVDVNEARSFKREIELNPDQSASFMHHLPLFVHGQYRNTGSGNGRRVRIDVELQGGEEGTQKFFFEAPYDEVGSRLREAVHLHIGGVDDNASAEYNPQAEATSFWELAHQFMRVGQTINARGALEAALLVVPESAVCTSNMWAGYKVPSSQIGVPVRQQDVLRDKLLRLTPASSDFLQIGNQLIEQLLRSSLPPPGLQGQDCAAIDYWNRAWRCIKDRSDSVRAWSEIRKLMLRFYQRRPDDSGIRLAHWQGFIEGTYPYIFPRRFAEVETPEETIDVLCDVVQLIDVLKTLPDPESKLVSAIRMLEGLNAVTLEQLTPFLADVEAHVDPPLGPLLAKYARFGWYSRRRYKYDDAKIEMLVSEIDVLIEDSIKQGIEPLSGKGFEKGLYTRLRKTRSRILLPLRNRRINVEHKAKPNKSQEVIDIQKKPIDSTYTLSKIDIPHGEYVYLLENFGTDLTLLAFSRANRDLQRVSSDGSYAPFITEALPFSTGRFQSVLLANDMLWISFEGGIVVANKSGRVMHTTVCGEDLPVGVYRHGVVIDDVSTVWVGTRKTKRGLQTWLIEIESTQTGVVIDTFYEAKLQGERDDVSTQWAFSPSFAVAVGPPSSRKVLVGKSGSHYPLLVDCNTKNVSVFSEGLFPRSGGHRSPIQQFAEDGTHIYWLGDYQHDGTLFRMRKDDLKIEAILDIKEKLRGMHYEDLNHSTTALRLYQNKVFFYFRERNEEYGKCRIGYVDLADLSVHVFSEVSSIGNVTFHESPLDGLVICGMMYNHIGKYIISVPNLDDAPLDGIENGMVVHRRANGQAYTKVEFLSDGTQHRITHYYITGSKKTEVEFLSDGIHHRVSHYYITGNKKSEDTLNALNERDGPSILWTSSGRERASYMFRNGKRID